jgi:hypothetical protein
MQNDFSEKALQLLTDKYPFLTLLRYSNVEYIGIIQNADDAITTLYDYGAIINLEQKQAFLEMADTWWWESNRGIPINIFLKEEWAVFKPYLRTFINKDLEVLHGPITSLNKISEKKIKRRSVTLVRRMGQ